MSLPEPYYRDEASGIVLYNADCREILPLLEPNSIDLVLTDPPYGHNNNSENDLAHVHERALGRLNGRPLQDARPIANDGPEANDLVRWMYGESERLLRPGCCCCCCGGGGGPDPQFARWSLWMDEAIGFKQMVVWDKGGLGMGWHYRRSYEVVLVGEKPGAACHWFGGNSESNVIRMKKIIPSKNDHPTPKPVSLGEHFIRLHSQRGDIVLDPFMGSGPFAQAAKLGGRKYIGIEVSQEYCEMAVRRLSQQVLPLGEIE